ncbi:Holliday junction resolvase RuvX [Candidatus Cardinium hertigii]|uniref:Putative pre-16S rRNA nuclease n=2 Tax=Candidatus Cardinium hertigii TaxID=247481 RepID=A0A3N2QD41_9BACT|nr:Holliday junction resolvase RuvX [Candidatus Cardinium hertigii]
MCRIMAIDYGLKRVGIAVTDPLQIIATPLTTIASHTLFFFLKQYLQKEIVSIFVIGMPQGLDGKPSEMSKVMERVGAKLKNAFPQQSVCYQDERFTSQLAAQGLYQAGYRKKDRQNKANIDKVSAAILLQSYLRTICVV